MAVVGAVVVASLVAAAATAIVAKVVVGSRSAVDSSGSGSGSGSGSVSGMGERPWWTVKEVEPGVDVVVVAEVVTDEVDTSAHPKGRGAGVVVAIEMAAAGPQWPWCTEEAAGAKRPNRRRGQSGHGGRSGHSGRSSAKQPQ